ncbi:hypothetical protein ACLOJK_031458 [Asimina triloba]
MEETLTKFHYSDTLSHLILAAVSLIAFFFIFNLLQEGDRWWRRQKRNLPPGSLGLPVIGKEWISKRVAKHGSVFKTSLMGSPAVVIIGQAGNRFVFSTEETVLIMQQPRTTQKILGKSNIFDLNGNRHKLVRGAMSRFLKPESLQECIRTMHVLVRTNLQKKLKEDASINLVPLFKELTFDVSCSLLFGFYDQATKEALFEDLAQALEGIWAAPVNFPGTVLWRSLRARSRLNKRLLPILRRRKDLLEQGAVSASSDVISSLIAARDENQRPISEEEILDNIITVIMASHDTTTSLLSLIAWRLGRDPNLQQSILRENVAQKMRHTWRVAQETMRLVPIVFGQNRRTLKDISFGGYHIPKGWQVFCMASTTQMDESIFDEPEEFDPSRFHNPSKPIPPFSFIPFGAGQRMCVGNEFARAEVLTIIHTMVTTFEWSALDPDEIISYRPFPYPCLGLPTKIKRRTPSKWTGNFN